MKKNHILLAVGVVLVLAMVPFALGQAVGGNTTVGVSERATGSGTTAVGIEGGNVTYTNVTSIAITGRWAGFYGQVSGEILLGDSSGNKFYEWSVSDVSGSVVFATNDTVSDWTNSNIVAANHSVLPGFILDTATDNYNNTFNDSETFTSLTLTETDTNYTRTFQNGTMGNLKTYALHSTADDALIFAAKAIDESESFKTNDTLSVTVDYQLLLPAQSVSQYYFYLELV